MSLAPAAGAADPDRLTDERRMAISSAYDRVLEDPAARVDWLPPTAVRVIAAAYGTHDPETRVDAMPHARWLAVQDAFSTHDPERIVVADADPS